MKQPIKTWVVDFIKPFARHTEYITGTEDQVKAYVESTNRHYGTTSSVPAPVRMPKLMKWNEKKINLVGV